MRRYRLPVFFCLALVFTGTTIAQEHKQSDFRPRISPDGNFITYYSYRNDSLPDIYKMDLRTKTESQLTRSYRSWDLNPEWSKDGQYIYFSSDRNGEMSIFRMRHDGSQMERITSPPQGYRHSEISFSADGKKMLYAEFQPDRKTSLIIKDTDSGDEITILSSKRSGDEFYKPFIHPMGNEVIFLRNMAKDSTYTFDIFSLDVKSGKIENLTNTPNISERMPNWSDDGRYLVYSSDARGPSFDLYKCLRGGGSSKKISFVNSRQELNAHLANSKLVFDSGYYGMEQEGNTFIYLSDDEGKNIIQLTE